MEGAELVVESYSGDDIFQLRSPSGQESAGYQQGKGEE